MRVFPEFFLDLGVYDESIHGSMDYLEYDIDPNYSCKNLEKPAYIIRTF